MPRILMPPRGQHNLVRGTNIGGKLDGAQAEHLWGWTNNPTYANWEAKWSKEGDDIGWAKDMGVSV